MDAPHSMSRRRGSVLLIVLVTLVFATSALLLFIDKAGTDLIVDIREADASRLRLEAYSALETSLAVLEDFRIACDGLHGVAEGWGNPLEFAGYVPQEGNTVEVAIEDESAKLPLASVKAEALVALFQYWGMPQLDAERVADSLLLWVQKDHTSTAIGAPTTQDYDAAPLPFAPPARSLRSFSELAAIEGVRQAFFDPDTGLPNDFHRRFTQTFSLFRYDAPNFNGNRLEPLLAREIYDATQLQRIGEYLSGAGAYQSQGPGVFRNARAVAAVVGTQASGIGYGYEVKALRITVTVRRQLASFRLSAVVAPSGGARVVRSSDAANSSGNETSSSGNGTAAAQTSPTSSSPATAVPEPVDLKYPFTFLEIRENDGVVPPPAPSEDQTE